MMYKKFILLFLSILIGSYVHAQRMESLLRGLPGVSDVTKIETPGFHESYSFSFEQPVDHNDKDKGTFKQQVLIQHNDFYSPIVVSFEGGKMSGVHKSEPADLLGANQIVIEHRFFGRSVPDGGKIPWKGLTIYNAASDLHRIIEVLKKEVYPGCKWLSTGEGKGGQAAVFHRFFYENDVDVSVCYATPLCMDRIDERLNKAMLQNGRGKRNLASIFGKGGGENINYQIRDFQEFCFAHFSQLLPLFKEMSARKGYSYSEYVGSEERALKYVILQYQFSYWQKGIRNSVQLPKEDNSSVKDFFNHLVEVSDPGFFDDARIAEDQPLFYQAFTETGYYNYDITPFKKYFPEEKGSLDFSFALGEETAKAVQEVEYNKDKMKYISRWLQADARTMIFVYGGLDAWSGAQVNIKDNRKCYKFLSEDKAHGACIRDFDPVTRDYITDKLLLWMER